MFYLAVYIGLFIIHYTVSNSVVCALFFIGTVYIQKLYYLNLSFVVSSRFFKRLLEYSKLILSRNEWHFLKKSVE